MENGSGLVHEPEKARAYLKAVIKKSDHEKALSGKDIPLEPPCHAIPLDQVGICGKTAWILLPQGRMGFELQVMTNLPAEYRGIHMSRIEEVIAELYPQRFSAVMDYGISLAEKIISVQEGNRCIVKLSGLLPHLTRSPVSEKISVDSVKIYTEVSAEKDAELTDYFMRLGIEADHITACPCTQEYVMNLAEENGARLPLLTHSQRSRTMLAVEDTQLTLTVDELYTCLENALHLVQDLLKRPDEAETVLNAHANPSFAEDTVREVAACCYKMFNKRVSEKAGMIIESRSLESIHIHDVICRLETTFSHLKKYLSAT